MRRLATLLFPLLLTACSNSALPPPTSGSMVVRPAQSWPYVAPVRYAIAEQFQYAGPRTEGWLLPVQLAVEQSLHGKGWQAAPIAEADLWVAIGVADATEVQNGELFRRLGMTPGLAAPAGHKMGSLTVVLLDRRSSAAVWSASLQLETVRAVPEDERGALSQRWIASLLQSLPR